VTLADDAREVEVDRLLAAEQAKVADARRERDSAKHALKEQAQVIHDLENRLQFVDAVTALSPSPPKWLSPKKARSGNRATVTTILSDSHFDEVVNPDEVGGTNAYDRDIATKRLKRYFELVVRISRDLFSGVTYDGCVLMLGGDLFSGDIHDELSQTNEPGETILSGILYWSELVAAGIDMLADEFGKVHVPVVVGNHGRRSRKPRAKMRAKDNFDWLFGHVVAREFAADDRVTFDIPEEADCRFSIYDTDYLLTHGDQFRGGNGIAGIWSPIMKGDAKKRSREAASDRPYDILVMGHWHQLKWGGQFIINGSLKSVDEYAWTSNFDPEPAAQAMWLTTPEHGASILSPVFCADRKVEGW
jgi:hypothetical protein